MSTESANASVRPAISSPGFALLAAITLLLAGCGSTISTGNPERGQMLYSQTTIDGVPGCSTCHSTEAGAVKAGPSHAGIVARAERTLKSPEYNGAAQDVRSYLRESILEPDRFVRAGYEPGIMFQGYADVLSEEQIADLVSYLLTVE